MHNKLQENHIKDKNSLEFSKLQINYLYEKYRSNNYGLFLTDRDDLTLIKCKKICHNLLRSYELTFPSYLNGISLHNLGKHTYNPNYINECFDLIKKADFIEMKIEELISKKYTFEWWLTNTYKK